MKEKLIAALRSGEYEQARGALRNEEGYCCLGVACDIYLKETGEGKWRYDGERHFPYTFATNPNLEHGEVSVMPKKVQEFFEFKHNNPSYSNRSLAGLNDGDFTFEEIADLLEMEDDLTYEEFEEVKQFIGDGLHE